MDIIGLEKRYSSLQASLAEPTSNRIKLLNIKDFIDFLLSGSNKNLIDAYLPGLLPEYILLLKAIKIRGIRPDVLDEIIDQFNSILEFDSVSSFKSDLEEVFLILSDKQNTMSLWLNENKFKDQDDLIYFPVIEKFSHNDSIGFLEIVKVKIGEGESQFIIEPYQEENDYDMQEQLHLCWKIAISYCKKFIKNIKPSHRVELNFENRLGIYAGKSLGMALILAFIEALLKHYNAPVVIRTNGIIAMSGGINKKDNHFIELGNDITEIKVQTVFYSDAKSFCIPKNDEDFALSKLKSLQAKYPGRKLEITGLADFEDMLNRRNIVEIKRYNLFERLAKLIILKWPSILFAVILTTILLYFFALDFNDNPARFEQKGNVLTVKNKNGKDLWSVILNFNPEKGEDDRERYTRKILDIDSDGINEVLVAEEFEEYGNYDLGRVVCFDKDKNIIWEYSLKDTVSTFRRWTNRYQIGIVDTVTINGKNVLLLIARNIPNFQNAIFTLDPLTGLRIDSTSILWNAGAITNVLIGDFNEDGGKELIVSGNHNGFERAILFSVDVDKLKGQTPAPERYKFNNIPYAKLNKFILLPHSDYGKYYERFNIVIINGLYFTPSSGEVVAATREGVQYPILFYYGFDKELNFLWVDCADNAQRFRDSLVTNGILEPPLTNTSEYFKILEEQVIYLNTENF